MWILIVPLSAVTLALIAIVLKKQDYGFKEKTNINPHNNAATSYFWIKDQKLGTWHAFTRSEKERAISRAANNIEDLKK
jgi:hypothetical protein